MRGQFGLYSPRLDIAVGPFAEGEAQHGHRYDELLHVHADFIERLFEYHQRNVERYGEGDQRFSLAEMTRRNWNSRCYLAIEIENKVSRKHLMGGAVNAAALGRLGIAVGWTPEKVRAFVKLRSYLLYLARVGKNTFNPVNLLVLSKEQMIEAINRKKR